MSTIGAMGWLLGFGAIFIFVAVLVVVACYVLLSYPLYQIAKRSGMENAWFAWIPVLRMYVLCMLPAQEEYVLFGQWRFPQRSYAFIAYAVLRVLSWLLNGVPFLGLLCSVAIAILVWRMAYDFIRVYSTSPTSTETMVLSVFCAIFSIVLIVVLWIYRNNEPKVVVEPYYDNQNIR